MCLHVKCLSFATIRRSLVLIVIYAHVLQHTEYIFSIFALKLKWKGGTFPNIVSQHAMQSRIATLNHVSMIVIHQKMSLLLTGQDCDFVVTEFNK